MRKQTKSREQWFAQFEAIVTRARPAAIGKMDWNLATHLFNGGLSPHDGALRAIATFDRGGFAPRPRF